MIVGRVASEKGLRNRRLPGNTQAYRSLKLCLIFDKERVIQANINHAKSTSSVVLKKVFSTTKVDMAIELEYLDC